jgi:alpha/beta superfamily hydrolase
MDGQPIIHERICFGPEDRLIGILSYPAAASPARGVLLCSPHPNFAGDMDNNVIVALAEQLARRDIVLRFDYRGIGQSRIDLPPGVSVIDFWDQLEQTLDYSQPLQDTAHAAQELLCICGRLPVAIVGYSFGAVKGTRVAVDEPCIASMVAIAPPLSRVDFNHLTRCAKRCLLISGTTDFVFSADVAQRLTARAGNHLVVERVEGADHFFRKCEATLVRRVEQFLGATALGARPDSLHSIRTSAHSRRNP